MLKISNPEMYLGIEWEPEYFLGQNSEPENM
jgi:hypothetical protein